MSNFASAFTPISVTTAKDKISSTDKFILFIGRPSCPYCQLFEPKLSNVARNSNLTIFYINSENSEELDDIISYIMVLLPFQLSLFQKMELLRLFVTLLFLRMTF